VTLTTWGRGVLQGRAIGRDRLGRDAPGRISGPNQRFRRKRHGPGCQEWIIVPPSPCCSPGPEDVSIGDWVASLSCPRARYAIIPTDRASTTGPSTGAVVCVPAYGAKGKRTRARLGDEITGEELRRAINDREVPTRDCACGSPLAGRCRCSPVSAKPFRPVKGKRMGQTNGAPASQPQ
jgi:hypothetical protein